MSALSVKDVFDKYTNFKTDKKFAHAMIGYVQYFISKNDTHVEFFGNALVGVKPVRYVPSDAVRWLEDILGIEDINDCQSELFEVKGINRDWKVSSDIVNLSFIYVVHRLYHSKDLRDGDKFLAMQECLVMNMAKHLCSLMAHRFKFPADPIVAQQLYESLDLKSHLKLYGSFLAMLRGHAVEFLDPKEGIHYNRYRKFDDTEEIIYVVSDIQRRLAVQMNLLTEKYHEVKDSQQRILVKSSVAEMDGEKVLREYANKQTQLVRDMREIVLDPRDFIRDEIIDHVTEIIQTCDERYLKESLNFIADNYRSDELYEDAIRTLVVYIITEAKQGQLSLSNLPEVIGRLRSIIRSSRTKKKQALKIKQQFADIVEESIPRARPAIKTSTQISLIIYIAIRMLTIHKYR